MCSKSHVYTVEVIGQNARYSGADQDEAVSALLTIDPSRDEEGYVVAEHTEGDSTSYCPAESNRIENEAIRAQAGMDRKWAEAVEAFHGDGPYIMAEPPF